MPAIPVTAKKLFVRTLGIIVAVILAAGIPGPGYAPVYAAGGPDLIVENISFSPVEPVVDGIVSITVTVKNQGTERASSFYVVCNVDSVILATRTMDPLEPGTMATATFTWTAQTGSHTIKATADSNGSVSETDETNNTATFTLTPLAPDLLIGSVSWSPPAPSSGDDVTFTVSIRNDGSAPSRPTTVILYIGGVSRGYQDIPSIEPGQAISKNYPWVARPGQHAVAAVIDDDNRNNESNENNNQLTITFSTEAPDLVIGSISHTPEDISQGDSVIFTITVTNQGRGRSDACYLGYSINEEMRPLETVPELDAGVSYNVTVAWTALSGSNQLRAAIDYFNVVQESDETNNESSVNTLTLKPDLIVADITWTPADAAVGDTVSIGFTVQNQGEGRAGPTRTICSIGIDTQEFVNLPAIDAGDEVTAYLPWVVKPGSHRISVSADYDSRINETREDNNKFFKYLNALLPDLVVQAVTWTPEFPAHGESVSINITIENRGAGRSDSSYVGYYIDGELVYNSIVMPLSTGQTVFKTYTWTSEKGYHTFEAVADFKKSVREDDESNNGRAVYIMAHMPDLVIDTVTWSPAEITPGQDVTFDIGIRNTGTLPAPLSRVAYYVDGEPAGYADIPALPEGGAATERFIWPVGDGIHRIEIIADATGLVEEIDEANNTRVLTLPPPDVVIQNVTWTPAQPRIGDTIALTVTVGNRGDSATLASTINCAVDGEPLDTRDLPEIAPGGTVSRTFEWVATASSHRVTLAADTMNTVIETDETNNGQTLEITTLMPDLSVGDMGWRVENPLIDGDTVMSVVIINHGTDAAGASRLRYTMDDREPVYDDIPEIPAGGTYEYVFNEELEPREHTLVINADTGETVIETDETNNGAAFTFDTDAPDLIIRGISLTPREAGPGDNVTISVKVENRGTSKAVDAVISLSVDGSPVEDIVLGKIDTGGIATGSFNWTVQAGMHEISVFADYGGAIPESDETNNSKARTLTFEEPEPSPVRVAAPVTGAPPEKGFMEENWWMIMLVAAVLGGGVFISLLRSFRKD